MEQELKFKDAMNKLEQIVNELETGDFDLDKAINMFEDGIKLSKFLRKKLDEAEQKIEVIKKKEASGLVDESNTDISDESAEDYTTESINVSDS